MSPDGPERGRVAASVREWFDDPHLGLDTLTPGQRYTAVVAAAVAALMIAVGLPHLGRSTAPPSIPTAAATPTTSASPQPAPTTTTASTDTTLAPLTAPPETASITPVDTTPTTAPPAEPATTTTTASTTTTTSTTQPPSCAGLPPAIAQSVCGS